MPIEEKYDEPALLLLLAEGSIEAFQLLFDRYRNTLYNVSMMYVKSPVIAEEIVQDVFLKLWFKRKLLTEIRLLEPWLFTLTKNLTLNCLKKIAHECMAREKWFLQNRSPEISADHKVRNAECLQILRLAVTGLSPQQQQVYKLAKEQGLSYDVIGRQLRISPLTVKTHMARALAAIRLFLQQHGELSVLFIIAAINT